MRHKVIDILNWLVTKVRKTTADIQIDQNYPWMANQICSDILCKEKTPCTQEMYTQLFST